MPRIVKQPDVVQTILDLQKRITRLENAPRLTASNIQTNGNSRLSVSNVAGQTVLQAGDLPGSNPASVISGLAVFRPSTGQSGLVAFSGSTNQFGLVDTNNHVVVQTNENSGYGLEDPSIPITLYANANIPSTTSGTDVTFWNGAFNATHSFLDVQVLAAVSGGATGSISLSVNGSVVATQTTTSASLTPLTFSNAAAGSAGGQKTLFGIQVLGHISSGAGTLQILIQYARLHGSLG